MLYFVLAGLTLLILLGGVATGVLSQYSEGKTGGFLTAGAALLAFIVLTVAFSATTVGARSVAVQTAFGRYQNTLQSGLHWTAPWSHTEEFSTRIQPLDLEGQGDAVGVNFQGGGQGTVNATVRWYIDTDNAEALWRKYSTFDNVRDNLVKSSAKDSFRVVLGGYTPNDARAGENLRPITEKVRLDLDKTLAKYGVSVDSISVKGVVLDNATQRSLEKIVVANNDIERAKSEQERALIDAKTAEIRQKAGNLSGQALARYCLDVTNSWDTAKNGPLPAGWTCLGGSNVLVASK